MARRIVRRGRDPVYGIELLFIYGPPSTVTAAEINAFINEPSDVVTAAFLATVRGLTVCGDYPRVVIYLAPGEHGKVGDISTIAHEAQHAVMHVLQRAGIPPTESSDEAYAYYLEFIVTFCLEAVFPTGRVRR